jgi:DNA polymerase-3 subunit gamma/tau
LFSGPRGTGKTSAAKIFAKAINCLHPETGEPDNTCEICQAVNNSTLEDVIELDAASNNGVDEIREIRDKSTYAATRATYKVYIIDEVHMLSTGAFNALLKTLEEPTENVVFVLATTELQKIPATILSRVQRFAFKAITTADIRAHLEKVMGNEKVEFEPAALDIIAKSAEGGMRDALSLLDQALSFSEGKVSENDALLVTGSIAQDALVAYVSALQTADAPAALKELDNIFSEGKNMLRFTEDLLAYFRDQLLDAHSEISHEDLYRWIDIAIDNLRTLRETTQTKIAADVMTMRLTEPRSATVLVAEREKPAPSATRTHSVTKKVAVKISKKTEPAGQEKTEASAIEEIPTKVLSKQPTVAPSRLLDILNHEAKKEIKQQIEAAWSEVIESLSSPREMALIKIAHVEAASENDLILSVEHENLAAIINGNSALTEQISTVLTAAVGLTPAIQAITQEQWQQVVADFMAQRQETVDEEIPASNSNTQVTTDEENPASTAKKLFGDAVVEIED